MIFFFLFWALHKAKPIHSNSAYILKETGPAIFLLDPGDLIILPL